jgi:type II secretory pathway component PulK
MRRARTPGPPRGAALVVVLVLILAMIVIAGAFAYAMKVESRLSVRGQSHAELDWAGRSGVEFAKWVLDTQRRLPSENTYDALNQFWAGGPGPTNSVDNPFLDVSLTGLQLGDATLSVSIEDQERYLNVNSLNQLQLELLLQLAGAGAGDAASIAAAIMDWRDPNDTELLGGAESSSYYLGLPTPYFAKNGPVDELPELLLVRGISPDLYWGGSVPVAVSPGRGQILPQEPLPGLVSLLCAVSSGRVNINTASPGVLRAMFSGNDFIPSQILQRRQGPDGVDGSLDDFPFRNPAELQPFMAVGGTNNPLATGFITQSSTFEVRVLVQMRGVEGKYRALLRRGGSRELQIMTFRPE